MRQPWIWSGAGAALVVVLVGASVGLGGGPPPPNPPPRAKLGDPFPGLKASDLARFNAGQTQFLEVETPAGGLGPVFNDRSCVACHDAGATGGAGTTLVTRFGRLVDGQYDPMVEFGGPLIQSRGIGLFNGVNFVGETVPPEATIQAHRRTTPLFGLGLIDAINDADILALAHQQSMNTPDIAGRPNPVADLGTSTHQIGRFGWKAQHATLFAFAADAYHNELGVTTPALPDENAPGGDASLLVANPALTNPNDTTDEPIQTLSDFIGLLAPPTRVPPGPSERAGEILFAAIGCAGCHHPTWQTGPNAVRALSNARFSPYSDFLVHDMGALGDGITQNEAGGNEFRTPPLWGLRFQPTLLHDGRAATPESAILQHDGQGKPARNRFVALRRVQKMQLISFLNSL